MIRETFGASLEMGSAALQELGWLPHEARQNTLRFRAHDELMVQNSVQHQHDQDKLISLAKQGRAALEQVMKEDLAEYQKREQHWT